jgi:hypothetical protein
MKTVLIIFCFIAAVIFTMLRGGSNSVPTVKNSGITQSEDLFDNSLLTDENSNELISDDNGVNLSAGYSGFGQKNRINYVPGFTNDTEYVDDGNYYYDKGNSGDTISLKTLENTLSSDGKFVSINENEIDPENISTDNNGTIDDDIYTTEIWIPNEAAANEGWNPYINGHWIWTDWGWSWVSDYNWGWATYHYGRWWYSPVYGWVWSPGRCWAPSWVFWGHHRNYVGWYPISPRFHHRNWHFYTGGRHHFNQNHWVFVQKKDFLKKIQVSTVMPYKKNDDILKNTVKTIGLKDDGKKIFNSGPDIKSISNATGKKINQVSVTKVTDNQKRINDTKKITVTKTDPNLKKVNVVKNNDANIKTIETTKRTDIKNKGSDNIKVTDKNTDNKKVIVNNRTNENNTNTNDTKKKTEVKIEKRSDAKINNETKIIDNQKKQNETNTNVNVKKETKTENIYMKENTQNNNNVNSNENNYNKKENTENNNNTVIKNDNTNNKKDNTYNPQTKTENRNNNSNNIGVKKENTHEQRIKTDNNTTKETKTEKNSNRKGN